MKKLDGTPYSYPGTEYKNPTISSDSGFIIIGNLEVMTEDLAEMNWSDAMKNCADPRYLDSHMGNGWRLPTKDELNILYENQEKIGGFGFNYYWSSTESDTMQNPDDPFGPPLSIDNSAWSQGLTSGFQKVRNMDEVHSVRAVR